MSCRGRGTLEIRDSNNPFMVTNNQMIGASLSAKEFEGKKPYRPENEIAKRDIATKYDMSFLYSRESERIGEGVPLSDNKLARLYASGPTKSETAKMIGHAGEYSNPKEFSNVSVDAYLKTLRDEKLDVTRLLNSYNHDPKDQNPLYATTQNEFGIKKPTAATYTTERLARNQAFSNSYNSQMPRDQGLNTSLTKSNVHTELNPQFI
ncbi:hypothetical protein TL16_g06862 [Triparma laevis f. inornata]|uniref:Uncharacterized protein n=2 Tax=Triparma laevis TaxID=1534972 RepID=A0A9W7FPC6_9STRA|nr:hypothetical protein TL16_g06862 [Triparma laevis f. inornata]GMI15608.1 hypothetical protein TrLO_g14959 [Triparma laevis f. longispina]